MSSYVTSDITHASENTIVVKGKPISELISDGTPAYLVLLLGGVEPTPEKERLVNALVSASVDHGLWPPSTIATRLVAGAGGDLQKGIIAGLSCMGEAHGPISTTVEFLTKYTPGGPLPDRVPGFGHPVHSEDPRKKPIRDLLSELGWESALDKLVDIESRLPVKANLAGLLAACCIHIGLNPYSAQLVLLLGRIIGLTAHYSEQKLSKQGLLVFNPTSGTFSK